MEPTNPAESQPAPAPESQPAPAPESQPAPAPESQPAPAPVNGFQDIPTNQPLPGFEAPVPIQAPAETPNVVTTPPPAEIEAKPEELDPPDVEAPAAPEANQYPGKVSLAELFDDVAQTRNINRETVEVVLMATFSYLASGPMGKAMAVLGHGMDVAKKRALKKAFGPKVLAKRG